MHRHRCFDEFFVAIVNSSIMINNLVHSGIFIQSIGFVAFVLSLSIFQVNKRSSMLRIQLSACFLYAIHFFMLGAFTGAAVNVAGVARNFLFEKFRSAKHSWVLPIFFISIFFAVAILTWQGPRSLLPAIASIGGTLAVWQKNPRMIRLLSLLSPPLWLIYNVLSGSYPGILSEIFLLTSTLIGIYRFDIRKKKRC